MGYPIQQSNTTLPLRFTLVLSSDHITGATGKTVTVTLAKNDGLGFVTPSGSVSEVGNGVYQVNANASDASTLGPISLHASAAACDPVDEDFLCVNYNPSVTVSQPTLSSSTKTVADLLTGAMLDINVIQSGETPAPEDLAIAFDHFNDWIDSVCANERLIIYSIVRTTWTIVSGTASYTVGIGGTVNIARPIYLDRVRFVDTSVTPNIELPLVKLTDEMYQTIPNKTQTSTYPFASYYNPTFPTGTLSLFYIPTSSTLQGVIYAPTAVTRFGATSDIIALPPGYNRFLRTNMAVELSASMRENVPIDPTLLKAAQQSKDNLKTANLRPMDLAIDPMWAWHGRSGNIYTGIG